MIVQMVTLLSFLKAKIERTETRLYCDGAVLPCSLAPCLNDFEQVKIMIETMQRLAIFDQSARHLRQTVRPLPRRIDRLELLPAARAVAPNLEAARVPIVAEQVRSSFGSIEFKRGTTIALDAMTGHH